MQNSAASAFRQSMPPSAARRDVSCCSGSDSSPTVRCPFNTTAPCKARKSHLAVASLRIAQDTQPCDAVVPTAASQDQRTCCVQERVAYGKARAPELVLVIAVPRLEVVRVADASPHDVDQLLEGLQEVLWDGRRRQRGIHMRPICYACSAPMATMVGCADSMVPCRGSPSRVGTT